MHQVPRKGARLRFARSIFICTAASIAFAAPAGAAVPHTVQPGETLWSIAAANNFTTHALAAYNGLSDEAQVYVGQTIQVPTVDEGAAAVASSGTTSPTSSTASVSGTTHTVQPGESLTSVAAANGISADTLAAENGLSADALLI